MNLVKGRDDSHGKFTRSGESNGDWERAHSSRENRGPARRRRADLRKSNPHSDDVRTRRVVDSPSPHRAFESTWQSG